MVNDNSRSKNSSSHKVNCPAGVARRLDRAMGGFLIKGSQIMAATSSIVIIILALVVFMDVIGHNTPFRVPWSAGTYELAELLMSLISVLGLSYCWYKKGHVRIELVIERLSPKVGAIFEMITSIMTLIFVSVIGWRLMVLAIKAVERSEETDMIKLPVGLFMFVFSIGMLYFVLVLAGTSLHYFLAIFGLDTDPNNE